MPADYQYTMLIRDLTAAMSTAHTTMAGLTAEMETLREDRDEEHQRRILRSTPASAGKTQSSHE